MKLGIFIPARMGSQRLPDKHLIKASGKMFIEWQLDRFYHEFEKEIRKGEARIFIVTSVAPENHAFEDRLGKNYPWLTVFYGSDGNIPLRQWQCAEANGIETIVSIDGDDVLCSTSAARKVAVALAEGSEMVKTIGLPLGMNSMGYSTALLGRCLREYAQKEKLETGWGKIFEISRTKDLMFGNHHLDSRLRFTLDYEDDKKFFQKVIEHFGDQIIGLPDGELIDLVIDKKVYLINHSLNSAFWENFYRQRNEE